MKTSRKRLFPLLVVVAVGCSAPEAPAPQAHYQPTSYADASDEIYALDNLVRFDLELAPESLQQLREQPREYAVGALRYRGQTLANVGVRLKGEASFRELDDKPAFKLKFDKFVKGQRFFGLKRMTLNNNVQDPSSLSQPLSYRVFRELGLPAPRCNSALVFVNGEYYGVYSNVETEDKVFLKRWFSSNDGNLYEENGIDLVAGAAALFNLETNEKQDNRSDLEALIEALEQATPTNVGTVVGAQLDLDHYLSFAALEALTGGEDGYSYSLGGPNNFRLYRAPSSDRFVFLPWGLDRALRPRFDPVAIHPWVPPLEEYRSAWDTNALVLAACLQSPECQAAYLERLDGMATAFEELDLAAQAQVQAALIGDAVRADSRKPSDDDYAAYANGLLRTYVQERPNALRAELSMD